VETAVVVAAAAMGVATVAASAAAAGVSAGFDTVRQVKANG
jgi:hypothetical protein